MILWLTNRRSRRADEQASRQYLTFDLAGEEYAIDILKVQEIRGFETTTRIPSTPDFLLGVINLRGSVVPIVDPRIRFDLPVPDNDSTAVIILVKVATERGERRRVDVDCATRPAPRAWAG